MYPLGRSNLFAVCFGRSGGDKLMAMVVAERDYTKSTGRHLRS
jgi:hypothetical protein